MISAIVPAYNAVRDVAACLVAIGAQSLPADEVIVVDDGSSDNTAVVAAAFGAHLPLRVLRTPHRGSGPARNSAIEASKGDLIMVCDADDVALPSRFEISASTLTSGFDAMGGQTLNIVHGIESGYRSRFPTDRQGIQSRLARGWDPLPHTTLAFRRDAWVRFGGYRPLRRAQDLELMLRWARLGASFAVVDEVLVEHRLRASHVDYATQLSWMLWTRRAQELAQLDECEADVAARLATPEAVRWALVEAARRTARLRLRAIQHRLRTVVDWTAR